MNNPMKRYKIYLFVSLFIALLLAGCGANSAGSEPSGNNSSNKVKDSEKMVIKLGHVTNDQSAIHKGSIKFKEIIEEKSNGTMEVQVIPGGQLGNEKDLVESTQIGTIHMTIPSAAVLSNFVPKASVLTLPYIIEGKNEREKYKYFQKLAKTDAYKEIALQSKEAGLEIFPEAVWWVGDRHVTTRDKTIETPEKIRGLKIRTPDATAHTEPFRLLKANVTPMNITEVYMSLKTGTIEAQENSINQIYTNKFQEVQNVVNLTGHMTQNELPAVNLNWWKGLTKDQKKMITDAMAVSGEYMSELQLKANEEELNLLKESGMKVVDVDIEAYKAATKDTYKAFEDKLGNGYYEKIKDAQK
ncbi:TRAP transporter substrate-binding protein [Metabacillus idriensis]|uniref:TRAP transporter substrate-binding protein n=1 Tax=Metabacillus idriensis TaxID=324768 RepID=UPI003D29F2DF